MTSAQPAIPDEALFFVAEKYSSVTELLRTLYNSPSQNTLQHFNTVNAHLKNGRVSLGQMSAERRNSARNSE
jgi:tRNA isopentenyl-2-thiomethyl-A-37 hydroxylase MiaE